MLYSAVNISLNMLNSKHSETADTCRGIYKTQSNIYNGASCKNVNGFDLVGAEKISK